MKATKCQCGAVTVEIDGDSYSMPSAEFRRRFPGQRAKSGFCNCNYCVNHWGIDLCGCGSGEKFGKCHEDRPECSRPAQSIESGLTHCTTDGGGWGKNSYPTSLEPTMTGFMVGAAAAVDIIKAGSVR